MFLKLLFFKIYHLHLQKLILTKMGRKPKNDAIRKKGRTVYVQDSVWKQLQEKAEKAGMDTSPFIISKALNN